MLDTFESSSLTLECAKLCHGLRQNGHYQLANLIMVKNQKRLKARLLVEIEAIKSQLRHKQKNSLSVEKLKLKNRLKFAAGKYDYIRLGIYKQNWRKLRQNRKSTSDSATKVDEKNLVLESERKQSYAESYMLIENYNCFMARVYKDEIDQNLTRSADLWAGKFGMVLTEGMKLSDKFHQDVCLFYSKKVELAVKEIDDLVQGKTEPQQNFEDIQTRLDDIENKLDEKTQELVKTKEKTGKKRKLYLRLVEDTLETKVRNYCVFYTKKKI